MCRDVRVRTITPFFLAAFFWLLHGTAQAAYPEKPLRLVVPFPPGGPTDLFGRLFAERLAGAIGQKVVVENRAGAGGNLGIAVAAKAPTDGYTLLLGTTAIATGAVLYKSLPYDPVKDLQPVALVATSPLVLLAPPQVPASVAGLVALLKASPGRLTFPSGGNGTSTHLAGELFKLKAGVDAVHVPYRGSGPAFQDAIAGRHAFLFDTLGASRPHVASGKLNLLAIANPKRSPTAPELPTFAEAGIEGVVAYTWNMVLAPAGTSGPVVDYLNRTSNMAVSQPAFAKRMAELAVDVIADSTPESAAAFLASEIRRWEEVVKASGIKLEE